VVEVGFLVNLSRKLLGEKQEIVNTELLPEHDVLAEKARQELQAAQSLFNHVVEKDLVDHAIFKLNAAERRYIFLLSETRRMRSEVQELFEKGGTPDWEK